ncbi:MAG: hypothetical protein MMC33_009270 [Icmadophila ericetorum]|nr:hypothetical protein [Icmadophila ericetorum]
MDVISSASSVFAVVSIAIQLADGLKTLWHFWDSVKEAPEDIQSLTADLQFLLNVLTNVASEAQHHKSGATFEGVLRSCADKIKVLAAIVEELKPAFDSPSSRLRKWTSLKAVFKAEKIKKFRDSLETLNTEFAASYNKHLVANKGPQNSALVRRQHAEQNMNIALLRQAISDQQISIWESSNQSMVSLQHVLNLHRNTNFVDSFNGAEANNKSQMPSDPFIHNPRGQNLNSGSFDHHSRNGARTTYFPYEKKLRRGSPWKIVPGEPKHSIYEGFLCTMSIKSKKLLTKSSCSDESHTDGRPRSEAQTVLVITPARWLVQWGFTYSFRVGVSTSTLHGWKYTIEPFRRVRDDALIFQFCEDGNVEGVRSLLSRGDASVKDTNSAGYTPLHVAARNFKLQLWKLLINEGADIQAASILEYEGFAFPWEIKPIHFLAAGYRSNYDGYNDDKLEDVDIYRLFLDSVDGYEYTLGASIASCLLIDSFSVGSRVNPAFQSSNVAQLCANLVQKSFDSFCGRNLVTTYLWLSPRLDVPNDSYIGLRNDLRESAYKKISNIKNHFETFSKLHHVVLVGTRKGFQDLDSWRRLLARLLRDGSDPYLVCLDREYMAQPETPTSLALQSALTFTVWRNALQNSSSDFQIFAENELQQSPLRSIGWDKDSLITLFQINWPSKICRICFYEDNLSAEPLWPQIIARIQNKEALGDLLGEPDYVYIWSDERLSNEDMGETNVTEFSASGDCQDDSESDEEFFDVQEENSNGVKPSEVYFPRPRERKCIMCERVWNVSEFLDYSWKRRYYDEYWIKWDTNYYSMIV